MQRKFIDPLPGVPLSNQPPGSLRAKSWMARVAADPSFDQSKAIQIGGVINMLEGLDYHYKNFMAMLGRLDDYHARSERELTALMERRIMDMEKEDMLPTEPEWDVLRSLEHEAFAYLNRMGQFCVFARAQGVETHLTRAKELMVFRNKHTAHRSIDDPRKETPEEMERHATAFGFEHISVNSFPVFWIILADESHQQFHMRDDHPVIMTQAMAALQAIHAVA